MDRQRRFAGRALERSPSAPARRAPPCTPQPSRSRSGTFRAKKFEPPFCDARARGRSAKPVRSDGARSEIRSRLLGPMAAPIRDPHHDRRPRALPSWNDRAAGRSRRKCPPLGLVSRPAGRDLLRFAPIGTAWVLGQPLAGREEERECRLRLASRPATDFGSGAIAGQGCAPAPSGLAQRFERCDGPALLKSKAEEKTTRPPKTSCSERAQCFQ